jgi:hypothetical protein
MGAYEPRGQSPTFRFRGLCQLVKTSSAPEKILGGGNDFQKGTSVFPVSQSRWTLAEKMARINCWGHGWIIEALIAARTNPACSRKTDIGGANDESSVGFRLTPNSRLCTPSRLLFRCPKPVIMSQMMLRARIPPPPTTIRGRGEAEQHPQAKSRIALYALKTRKTTICARAFIDYDRHHPAPTPSILLLASQASRHGYTN